MDRSLRTLQWKAPDASSYTDVTDAVESAVVSATPHPDDAVDRPKGYSVKMTLKPDSAAFADELQDALMALDPAAVSIAFEDGEAVSDVPVGVTRVPHLGEQNEAELSVKPDGHDRLHPHF
jgi:hypothetical protein